MSWNIKTPGDYINGPLTVAGVTQFNSNVGIGGPAQTFVRLDVVSGNRDPGGQGGTLTLGADMDSTSTRTGNTRKGAFVNAPHYSATEEKVFIIAADNDVSTNRLLIGGGYSGYNAATQIEFYTASSNTTTTGSLGATLNNTGFGIGVAPAGKLSVSSGGAQLDVSTSATNLTFEAINRSAVSNPIDTRFYTRLGTFQWYGGQYTELLRLNGNGALVLAGGATAASGVGITFPSAQSASTDANTLDDYEEGTFTPTIEGHTTAGTANYTVRLGQYTKTGRVVQFQLYVAWNSGTGTGQLKVTGLPFTGNATYPAVLQVYPIDVALVAGYYATASVPIGTSSVFVYQLPIGGGSDASVAYDAAGQLIITGSYTV
jgi:hypothetical protein